MISSVAWFILQENSLRKAKEANIDFADTVAKRREMWLKYQEVLKKNGKNRGMPERVLEIVRKASNEDENS